ncbi:hypothetical protein ACFPRL_23620 [Pseudoclavibacter helvolus]
MRPPLRSTSPSMRPGRRRVETSTRWAPSVVSSDTHCCRHDACGNPVSLTSWRVCTRYSPGVHRGDSRRLASE